MKAMGRGQRGQFEASVDTSRLKADGQSFATVKFSFNEAQPEGAQLEFKLLKHGSFSPDAIVRSISVPIEGQQAEVQVHSPGRPGAGVLLAEGYRQRFEFTPVSFFQSLVYEWVPTLVVSLVIALFLRSFVVASYYIPSGSMEGTLLKHDLLIADKLTYKLLHQGPRRGDVMIFQYPLEPKQDYIKRTIGLPGDTIEVRDGIVYVNDVALEEHYIKEQPIQDYGPVTVPEGRYFMMGDNRNHSSDSRVWGFVDAKLFEGRALFVFFPFTRAKLIQNELLAQDKVIPAGAAMAAEPGQNGETQKGDKQDGEAEAAAAEAGK